jgi:hypothetical protein
MTSGGNEVMKINSLDELKTAFEKWRSNKRYVQEPMPKELWERTLKAVDVHGLTDVARVTKIKRGRLEKKTNKKKARKAAIPSFSRVELQAPQVTNCPIAEVETATGLKLRVFAQTQEMLSLLSSLCSVEGS